MMLQTLNTASLSPILARMDEIAKLLRSPITQSKKALIRELITKGFSFPGALAQHIELLWPYVQHLLSFEDLIFQKKEAPEKGINLLWCLAWYSEFRPDGFLKVFESFKISLFFNHFMTTVESDTLQGKTAFWCLANAYKCGNILPMKIFEASFKDNIRLHHLRARAESPHTNADIWWLLANGLNDTQMFLLFFKRFKQHISFNHFLFDVKHYHESGSVLSTIKASDLMFKKIWDRFKDSILIEDFFVQEVPGLNKKQAALWKLAQSVYQGHMSYDSFAVFWHKISGEIKLEDLVARPNLEPPQNVSLLWFLSVFASRNYPEFISQVWQKFGKQIQLEHVNPKCIGTSPLYYILLSLTKTRNPGIFKSVWQRFKNEFTIEDFIPSPKHHQFGHDCLFSILLLQNTPLASGVLKAILQQLPGNIPESYLEEGLPFYLETSESDIGRKLSDSESVRSLLEKQQLLPLAQARKVAVKTVAELKSEKPNEQEDVKALVQKLNALQKENQELREKVQRLETSASLIRMQPRLPSVSEILQGGESLPLLQFNSKQNQGLPQVSSATNGKRQKLN